MNHAVPVSEDTYRTIETLARQQGTTLEVLTETLLRERLAERQALLRQNAEWEAGLDEVLARAARGENTRYPSTEVLFTALDKLPSEGSGT